MEPVIVCETLLLGDRGHCDVFCMDRIHPRHRVDVYPGDEYAVDAPQITGRIEMGAQLRSKHRNALVELPISDVLVTEASAMDARLLELAVGFYDAEKVTVLLEELELRRLGLSFDRGWRALIDPHRVGHAGSTMNRDFGAAVGGRPQPSNGVFDLWSGGPRRRSGTQHDEQQSKGVSKGVQ